MRIFQIFVAMLFIGSISYGHGSDKPGPHGGYIAMPGPFHTEIVPNVDKKSIQIFLLDVHFKEPVTKSSKVSAMFKTKKDSVDGVCKVNSDFFECTFHDKILLNEGELIIKSNRLGAFDGISIYKVPFASF